MSVMQDDNVMGLLYTVWSGSNREADGHLRDESSRCLMQRSDRPSVQGSKPLNCMGLGIWQGRSALRRYSALWVPLLFVISRPKCILPPLFPSLPGSSFAGPLFILRPGPAVTVCQGRRPCPLSAAGAVNNVPCLCSNPLRIPLVLPPPAASQGDDGGSEFGHVVQRSWLPPRLAFCIRVSSCLRAHGCFCLSLIGTSGIRLSRQLPDLYI